MPDQRLLAARIDGLGELPIGAQQMRREMLGHEPHFLRGGTRGVGDEIRLDPAFGRERVHEPPPGLVLADDADEQACRAERRDIARDIAGAADHDLLPPDGDHGRGRLGRNAQHFAVDEIVEHEVAETEQRLVRQLGQSMFEIIIEDRGDLGLKALQDAVERVIERSRQSEKVEKLFSIFRANVPQLYVDLDRDQCQTMGVNPNDVTITFRYRTTDGYSIFGGRPSAPNIATTMSRKLRAIPVPTL